MGEQGLGGCSVGTEFQVCKMKKFCRWVAHNAVNILNAAELRLRNVSKGKLYVSVLTTIKVNVREERRSAASSRLGVSRC